jgi:hypothetical protein
MHTSHFDALVQSLSATASRRLLLSRLTAVALGLGVLDHFLTEVSAKKSKKRLKRNEFGCVNVGGGCRGNSANCCSGICEGKKPKKGKKDRSRCVGHNQGICTQGQDACTQDFSDATECSAANPDCFCGITTGNAGFCGDFDLAECVPCRFDTDCETFGFPAGSACVRFTPGGPGGCGCSLTDNRACLKPCA